MRPGAVLSSWSAAVLWGLQPAGSGDGRVHVLVSANPAGKPRGVQVHRTRILSSKDTRIHQGLPVTSPARTLLDLAPLLTARQLERAYDQALVHHLTRPAHITELLKRSRGHPGHGRLTQIHHRERTTAGLTRSEAEELFLRLIRQARLPEPEVNAKLHGFEVDFLWRPQHVIVEIDGYRFHSTRSAFERDHHRDATLTAHGYTTLRFTWRQLKYDALAVIATVARALG